MKKILAILVGLSVLSFVLVGCGAKADDAAAAPAKDGGAAKAPDAK